MVADKARWVRPPSSCTQPLARGPPLARKGELRGRRA